MTRKHMVPCESWIIHWRITTVPCAISLRILKCFRSRIPLRILNLPFAHTVCCPVSGQKNVNSVIFDGILTLRLAKRSVRKTNSAINWWFWWGFWSRNERTRRDFVQVNKILPANFWPFHCTVKLPYVKKITRLIGNSSRSLIIFWQNLHWRWK